MFVFVATLAFFHQFSIIKNWITIENKRGYDRYLWGFTPLVLMAIAAVILLLKGAEGLETAIWLATIWLAAVAFEPAWAPTLKWADVSFPAKRAYNVWFAGLCTFCVWLVFIWFIWAKPGIEANTIWLYRQFFGG